MHRESFCLSSLLFVFIYRFENPQRHLRDYGVAVGFDRLAAPCRKGNSVQSGGKPIIWATYRGFSREPFPVRDGCEIMTSWTTPLFRFA